MSLVTATLSNLDGTLPPLPTGRAQFYNSDAYRAKPAKKPIEPAQPARRAYDHMLAQRQHNELRIIEAIRQGIGAQIHIARLLKLSPSTISIICHDLHAAGVITHNPLIRPRKWEVASMTPTVAIASARGEA